MISVTGCSRTVLAPAARVRTWAALFIATFLAAGPARPVWAQSPQQIEKAATDAAKSLDLQVTLPLERPKQIDTWSWPDWWPDWLTWRFRAPDSFDSVMLWIILAGIVGVLIYVFRDALPFGRPGELWQADEGGAEGQPQSHEEAALTAEDLARQGRYVEAMHVLLLRSLVEMRRHMGETFADSLTSREILRRARLSDAGRAAFRDIVIRVEWSYFGEHPAALADYTRCRESYDRLIAALHGEGASGARNGSTMSGDSSGHRRAGAEGAAA